METSLQELYVPLANSSLILKSVASTYSIPSSVVLVLLAVKKSAWLGLQENSQNNRLRLCLHDRHLLKMFSCSIFSNKVFACFASQHNSVSKKKKEKLYDPQLKQ